MFDLEPETLLAVMHAGGITPREALIALFPKNTDHLARYLSRRTACSRAARGRLSVRPDAPHKRLSWTRTKT